jgi:hypothetical protein
MLASYGEPRPADVIGVTSLRIFASFRRPLSRNPGPSAAGLAPGDQPELFTFKISLGAE